MGTCDQEGRRTRKVLLTTAAVLCPGPSTTSFQDSSRYDLVIGVNRAAALHACQYWVALDAETHDIVFPVGTPELVCKPSIYARSRYRGRLRHVSSDALVGFLPGDWWNYSSTVAIVYAAWRGCSKIEVFGMDWGGVADWDGWTAAGDGDRGKDRWEAEALLYSEIAAHLNNRLVVVTRSKEN
jgi:hypothetical protein